MSDNTSEQTRQLLARGARRRALADVYEAKAVELAEREKPTADTVAFAANCFVIANGLRGRARFLP